ncbi:TRAP transporter small permease subunit [Sneathiella sp.]|uniref:TRAP transporter small permease subunit n=1 Tax=Sneathiella sp. TaxID=1964365 RepID=UPI0035648E08
MNFVDKYTLKLGRILAWGFIIIVVMMTYEVVARYGFNAPTIWAHEIAGIIAATAFVFGGAYCMADDSHMRVTAIADHLGPKMTILVNLVSASAGIIYLTGLAFSAWQMTNNSLFKFTADGTWDPERSGSTWNTPSPSFIKFALFVGTTLFLIVLIQKLFQRQIQTD